MDHRRHGGRGVDRYRRRPERFSADDCGGDHFRRLLRRQDVTTLRLDQPLASGRGSRAVRSHPVHGLHSTPRLRHRDRVVRDSRLCRANRFHRGLAGRGDPHGGSQRCRR
jgi:hypothetical protein